MAQSAESDFTLPVDRQENHQSPWSAPDLYSGSTLPPALENRSPIFSTPGVMQGSETDRMLGGFSIGPGDKLRAPALDSPGSNTANTDSSNGVAAERGSAGGDRADRAQSFGDKLAGIVSKIGQFLESVLPPEYSQYVRQFLPMAEQFINKFLKDVKTSTGENGAQHLEADLHQAQSVPDVLPGTNLEIGEKLGFDMKWGENGPELSNIQGLNLSGETSGEVRSGRLDLGDGNPTLYASLRSSDGQENEVPIPLPDISSLIGGM